MKITHCKLKKEVQKEPLRSFVPEVTARSAADILGIHPDSAALFYRKIARLPTIVWPWLPMRFSGAPPGRGKLFRRRRKGRRGRGAAGKAVVFGIPKRNGRTYTVAADNAEPETLLPAVKKKSCRTVLFMPIARAAGQVGRGRFYPLPHQPFQGICRPSEPH
ncbi:IS1016 transposase [Neisseria gonorrhoeae]|nr:IS1016 transposase [Neisseria gonorrhoeae]